MKPPAKAAQYRSMQGLYYQYLRNCRLRNIFWGLALSEFHLLTSQNCRYCGQAPAQQRYNYTYNGIDRKNPKLGYEPSNSVPCCGECNGIKSNRLSFEEMKVIGRALMTLRKKRGRGPVK